MAQKDENIKTSDDEHTTKEEAEENKTESEPIIEEPKEEVTETPRGRSSSN